MRGVCGDLSKGVGMKRKKNYKLTKRDWMMLLDFYPLSILTPAILIIILLGAFGII
jgi:hypothetical protein